MKQSISSANISIFWTEISKFWYIKKYRYRLHFNTKFLILLTFFESLKIVSISMVAILMMSTKLATLDPEIKRFWNKGWDVTTSFHGVTSKILSRDSIYSVDVVMWPEFVNYNISMTKVIIISVLSVKINFLRGALGSSSIIWNWPWNFTQVWQELKELRNYNRKLFLCPPQK